MKHIGFARTNPIGQSLRGVTAPTRVLFVCQHGSAKSVIAAELMRRFGAQRGVAVECQSAGIDPDASVPSHVVAGLAAEAIDVSSVRPQQVSPQLLARAEYVVSFGCDLPSAYASKTLQWNDVPAVSDGFAVARDAIANRARLLLDDIVGQASSNT
jgi:arsenate reductase